MTSRRQRARVSGRLPAGGTLGPPQSCRVNPSNKASATSAAGTPAARRNFSGTAYASSRRSWTSACSGTRLTRCCAAGDKRASAQRATRTKQADADPVLDAVSLIFVDGSLASECKEALAHGHVRGADLWHLATALYIGGRQREQLLFISLDERQKSVAKQLGFSVWPAVRRAPA